MMRKLPLLIILSLLLSCLTTPEEESTPIKEVTHVSELPSWVFDSSPINGHPTFVVFSGRGTSREAELEAALWSAAQGAVKYNGIFVEAKVLSQEGETHIGYAKKTDLLYPEDRAVEFLDDLELDKLVYTNQGTIVRFIYTGAKTALTIPLGSNPPSWITSPPSIDGYVFAIGITEKHSRWKSSFEDSDKSAMGQIGLSLFGNVTGLIVTEERDISSRTTTGSTDTVYNRAEGIVRNMMIIGRWVDDEEKLFYSLAAAPVQGAE